MGIYGPQCISINACPSGVPKTRKEGMPVLCNRVHTLEMSCFCIRMAYPQPETANPFGRRTTLQLYPLFRRMQAVFWAYVIERTRI